MTFILNEKSDQGEGKKKVAELTLVIEKLGGSVTKEEMWGRRELAYSIKRNRTGFYTTLWFDLPPSAVKAVEQHLHFDEDVIRSLITKAYKEAQPGTLYQVTEEDKEEKSAKTSKEEPGLTEEMIRRASSKKPEEKEEVEEVIPEEERLKKLDEALEELLEDEEEQE